MDAIEMDSGWTLNHCGGDRTYLGRLVLQTKKHRASFCELTKQEAETLGTNIQCVNYYLRQYWLETYPKDPIERIYVVYLNETPYINRHIYLTSNEQFTEDSSVHIHLLPRTKEMGEKLGYCADKIGWHLLDFIDKFPTRYKITSVQDLSVKILMQYLGVHFKERM